MLFVANQVGSYIGSLFIICTQQTYIWEVGWCSVLSLWLSKWRASGAGNTSPWSTLFDCIRLSVQLRNMSETLSSTSTKVDKLPFDCETFLMVYFLDTHKIGACAYDALRVHRFEDACKMQNLISFSTWVRNSELRPESLQMHYKSSKSCVVAQQDLLSCLHMTWPQDESIERDGRV